MINAPEGKNLAGEMVFDCVFTEYACLVCLPFAGEKKKGRASW